MKAVDSDRLDFKLTMRNVDRLRGMRRAQQVGGMMYESIIVVSESIVRHVYSHTGLLPVDTFTAYRNLVVVAYEMYRFSVSSSDVRLGHGGFADLQFNMEKLDALFRYIKDKLSENQRWRAYQIEECTSQS